MAALSPRQRAPKLESTAKAKYGTPRRTASVFEKVALARGYTIRAGKIRRDRLHRGVLSQLESGRNGHGEGSPIQE